MPALPSSSFFWSLAQQASASYCPQAAEQGVSSPRFLGLMSSLLRDASELLGVRPTKAQILSTGMRSVVIRARFSPGSLELPEPGKASSVILKYFRRKDSASNSGGFGYLREKHGLRALNSLVPGTYPDLYAADDKARLLVLEDISPNTSSTEMYSLHHLLASQSMRDRAYGVGLYLRFWANLLESPAQEEACTDFARALGKADPVALRPGSFPTASMVRQGLKDWMIQQQISEQTCPRATTKLRQDIECFLYPPQESAVLTPGDFSPHNLFFFTAYDTSSQPAHSSVTYVPPTLRGIDAEGASIQHRALPFAELSLGFPASPHTVAYENLRQDIACGMYREQLADVLRSVGISKQDLAAARLVTCILTEQLKPTPDNHEIST